ncbi:MAG TPA: carbohydrate porin [Verrucomicrobiae bacterium]
MKKLMLLSLLSLPGYLMAQVTTNSFTRWANQDYMLGNWDGGRSWLDQHGVRFEFFYVGSLPGNLAGGIKTGTAYQGAAAATLDLDSEKLLGYAGGGLHVSGLWLHGQKPFSLAYTGDYNRVNLVDFDNALRFWEIYYRQNFLRDRLRIKVGRLSVDSDFIVPEYYTGFGQFSLINQTFAFPSLPFNLYPAPGFPGANTGLPALPSAAPGAVIAWQPQTAWTLQAGIYSGTPDLTYAGTRWAINQHDGALGFLEAAWRHNPGTNNPGLGGTLKVGGYYHTATFTDTYAGVFYAAGLDPAPARHAGNYAGYLVAEHQLWLEQGKADPAQQGLAGFARVLAAPADRNLTTLELDGGLVYRGLFPGRNWDSLAVAFSYLGFSDDIRRAQTMINQFAPGAFVPVDHENFIEVNYRAQLTAWCTLTGSYQHVFHPGGSPALPDADAFILQTTLRF